MKNLLTTKQVAEIMQISAKTILKYAKKYLPEKKIENGKTTFWTVKEVGDLIELIKEKSKVSQNNLQTEVVPKTPLMTTKELATILNTSPKVVLENAKKCLPNKIIENGKQTYWSKVETTVLIEQMKSSNPNQHSFTGAVKAVTTELTPALKLKKALDLAQEAYEEELARINAEKENLQIQLDESKEWYSVKRIQKLNPDVLIDWRMLKKESERLGFETKKVFDQNYGEVNAYHKDVYESLYFDTLDF